MTASASTVELSTLIQGFFRDRLLVQRNATSRTIASYRDAFRLLLQFAQDRTSKPPSVLGLEDLDAPLILAFLEHLEKARGNSVRTRNVRLAAIRSFMHYVSLRDPTVLPCVRRVLAIPVKRFDCPLLGFLSREEVQAIIQAPNRSTWSGQRDHVMFAVFYNTGARVSELLALKNCDISFNGQGCVRLHGKGRKDRSLPLWKSSTKCLQDWSRRIDPGPASPVFPNRNGRPLTRSGVESRLRVAVSNATAQCPSLDHKRVSPHTLRHTTAMHLLQSGVDLSTIALWLGHESPSTTHLYIEADLQMKERALEQLEELPSKRVRYRASDPVLAFLESL